MCQGATSFIYVGDTLLRKTIGTRRMLQRGNLQAPANQSKGSFADRRVKRSAQIIRISRSNTELHFSYFCVDVTKIPSRSNLHEEKLMLAHVSKRLYSILVRRLRRGRQGRLFTWYRTRKGKAQQQSSSYCLAPANQAPQPLTRHHQL